MIMTEGSLYERRIADNFWRRTKYIEERRIGVCKEPFKNGENITFLM